MERETKSPFCWKVPAELYVDANRVKGVGTEEVGKIADNTGVSNIPLTGDGHRVQPCSPTQPGSSLLGSEDVAPPIKLSQGDLY